MVEEKVEPREMNYRQLWPWTELFRGFQLAIDPKKLLLAAAGILVMAFSWWLLAVIFYAGRERPDWGAGSKYASDETGWKQFKADLLKWNLLYEAAGYVPLGEKRRYTDANDLALSPREYEQINAAITREIEAIPNTEAAAQVPHSVTLEGKTADGKPFKAEYLITAKPYGKLRTWPWFEDRGPNPYLLVSARAGVPWQAGHAWEWLLTKQIPVLIEPLVKLLQPVIYLLRSDIGLLNQIYFLLVILATVATWAFFGGALTRMAVVQIARKEKIGLGEALRFAVAHYRSYFFASLAPLLGVAAILVLLVLFGVIHLIAVVGELWVGLLWPVVVVLGLAMAVVLVGLVGWPLIQVTISAEGSDSFDALSRSYSYVYQKPWHYLWYCLVALGYGAVVVFFVGFMGSLMVYLGKVGVSETPFSGPKYLDRDPSYLFVYAPTSFGWRELLLQGGTVEGGQTLVDNGVILESARSDYIATFTWYNKIGLFLVSVWIYLVFLMIVGFGYSYFWSASTIMYLLMRRKVDDTEMDEVYLEDEEPEETYSIPTSPPSPSPAPASPGLTMVESPALRSPSPVTAPGAPAQGDHGNPPTG
jgi:hypothetical protein